MYAASYTSRPASACIGQWSNGTACAVVNARTLVTAKHTAIASGSSITVEGVAFTVTSSHDHPDADLRLLKVGSDLPRFSALPTSLVAVAGSVAMGGTGMTATLGGNWSGSRAERWGTNEIHSVVPASNSVGLVTILDEGEASTECIACLYDSGGFIGSTDGATMHGILVRASQPVNYGNGTGCLSLFNHAAWINALAQSTTIPVVTKAQWNAEDETLTLTFSAAVNWTGAANDIEVVESDLSVFRNSGAPSSGDGTTVLVFAMASGIGRVYNGGAYGFPLGAFEAASNSAQVLAVSNSGWIPGYTMPSTATVLSASAVIAESAESVVLTLGFSGAVTSADPSSLTVYLPDGRGLDQGSNTVTGGDTTATHTVSASVPYSATPDLPGTLDLIAGYGTGGDVTPVDSFPIAWTATAVTSGGGWLAPVSVNNNVCRYRQFVATGTGTKRIALKSSATATAYDIIVWQVSGSTLIEMVRSSNAACSFAGVDGVTYLVCMFNRSGSAKTIGWEVLMAAKSLILSNGGAVDNTKYVTIASMTPATIGTMAFWIKPYWAHADGVSHYIISWEKSASPTTDWFRVLKGSTGTTTAGFANGGVQDVATSAAALFTLNTWSLVLVEWNDTANTVAAQVDSTSLTPAATLNMPALADTIVIGRRSSTGLLGANAKVSMFAMWDRELTAQEKTDLLTLRPNVAALSGLVQYNPLEEDGDAVYGTNGTVNGSAVFDTEDGPPVADEANPEPSTGGNRSRSRWARGR